MIKKRTNLQSFEIEPRLRISNLPEGGLDESALTEEQGAPLTVRRITSYIDVTQSVNPLGVNHFI